MCCGCPASLSQVRALLSNLIEYGALCMFETRAMKPTPALIPTTGDEALVREVYSRINMANMLQAGTWCSLIVLVGGRGGAKSCYLAFPLKPKTLNPYIACNQSPFLMHDAQAADYEVHEILVEKALAQGLGSGWIWTPKRGHCRSTGLEHIDHKQAAEPMPVNGA